MHTAVGMYLYCLRIGDYDTAYNDWLVHIPGWQISAAFEHFAPKCPDRIQPPDIDSQGNRLRVDVMSPSPRCRQQIPADIATGLGRDAARRWLGSGGSPLVFGECRCDQCPRAAKPKEPP